MSCGQDTSLHDMAPETNYSLISISLLAIAYTVMLRDTLYVSTQERAESIVPL
jgi:hypothetical protein